MPFDPKAFEAFKAKQAKTGFDADAFEAFKAQAKKDPGIIRRFLSGIAGTVPSQEQGLAEFAGEIALPTAGAAIGSLASPVIGTALGAAAGRSVQEAISQAAGAGKTPLDVLKAVTQTGVTSAVIPTGLKALGKAGSALAKTGAKAIQATSGVREKFGEAALKGGLRGAKTVERAGEEFGTVLDKLGLTSLDESLKAATGRNVPTIGDFGKVFEQSLDALDEGRLTPQLAVWGRQAAAKIKEAAKLGNPEYAGVKAQIAKGQKLLDDYLETVLPGFRKVRGELFKAKTREAFSSFLPLTKVGQGSMARGTVGGSVLGTGLATGNPLLTALGLSFSPALTGAAIRATDLAARLGLPIARVSGPTLEDLLGIRQ